MSAWKDGRAEHQSPCLNCGSPTRSHVIFVDVEGSDWTPGTEETHDYQFSVCHTCYRDNTPEEVLEDAGETSKELEERFGSTFEDWDEKVGTFSPDQLEMLSGTKAVGQGAIKELAGGLEEGDKLEINGTGPWAIPPVDDKKTEQLEVEIIAPIVGMGESGGMGGAIAKDAKPLSDELYFVKYDQQGMNFEPIEELEVYNG